MDASNTRSLAAGDVRKESLLTTSRIAPSVLLVLLVGLVPVWAQSPSNAPSQSSPSPNADHAWSRRITVAAYFVPDEENYGQPTVTADRGALHLEARYNYEDHESISAFIGGNIELGDTVKLVLTPMIGGVTGRTDGVVPALELDFTWSRLEFYAEGEYVIDSLPRNNFLYSWSELSIWGTEWLRAGLVTQRTRIFHAFRTTRDIQRGLLVGTTWSKLEGTFYLFNPGSDDQWPWRRSAFRSKVEDQCAARLRARIRSTASCSPITEGRRA